MRKILTIIAFTLLAFTTKAQQTLISVNGWNAYVHVPWDYAAHPSTYYPTIIFSPGLGEVGSTASAVIANGPGAYIADGWNGNVKVGSDSVKFIVISLQPPSAWPSFSSVDTRIQTLKGLYRIDSSRMHLTGLSMGGWVSMQYVTGDNIGGPYYYANQVASIVSVEGVQSSDNSPWPNRFDNFALSGGKMLNFEQSNDYRKGDTVVLRMNATVSGSAQYITTNFGGGGHCCWSNFYGGGGTAPGTFTLGGTSQNIYQWMAQQSKTVITPPVTHKKVTLTAGGDGGIYFLNSAGPNFVTGGDTLCVAAGEYTYINLKNIHGTKTDTVYIFNCGGQVVVNGNNGTSYCYNITQSSFFRFSGSGTPGIFYGFKAHWSGGRTGSSTIGYQTTNYRADHFEADGVENGWLSKINPADDDITTWRGGWTVKNVQYDNSLIHNTNGEGVYFMNSDMQTLVHVSGRDTLVQPVAADTVNFFNMITDNTGWDGLQYSSCTNFKLHDNKVTNFGLVNMSSQQAGIILGGRCNGDVYNNYIKKGTGNGMQIAGYGLIKIYNNIIDSAGWDGTTARQDGLYIDDNPMPGTQYGGETVYVFNNTIANAGRGAIWCPNSYNSMATSGNRINNNLLIAPAGTNFGRDHYIDLTFSAFDTTSNMRVSTFAGAHLNVNYSPTLSTPTRNGLDMSSYFTTDYYGTSWAGLYNTGAVKFNSGSSALPVIIRDFFVKHGKYILKND